MRMYTLLFKRGREQEPRRVDFQAEDPADAFTIARREGGDTQTELWEGTKRLGRLTPMKGELWQID